MELSISLRLNRLFDQVTVPHHVLLNLSPFLGFAVVEFNQTLAYCVQFERPPLLCIQSSRCGYWSMSLPSPPSFPGVYDEVSK
mmetsp:Transcript_14443/g.22787  ORF Transcript_14443/g.22787 Transcript_14443/m.22787 type:complete len:83 (-) Transcript_14443:1600-1848(-)